VESVPDKVVADPDDPALTYFLNTNEGISVNGAHWFDPILTNFKWHDPQRAEKLLTDYLESGGTHISFF